MSARDDYPLYKGWGVEPATYNNMADEIDRLRASGSEHQAICVPIEAAKDELIRELTAHADALRDHVNRLILHVERLDGPWMELRDDALAAIRAYDNFVKEC